VGDYGLLKRELIIALAEKPRNNYGAKLCIPNQCLDLYCCFPFADSLPRGEWND